METQIEEQNEALIKATKIINNQQKQIQYLIKRAQIHTQISSSVSVPPSPVFAPTPVSTPASTPEDSSMFASILEERKPDVKLVSSDDIKNMFNQVGSEKKEHIIEDVLDDAYTDDDNENSENSENSDYEDIQTMISAARSRKLAKTVKTTAATTLSNLADGV